MKYVIFFLANLSYPVPPLVYDTTASVFVGQEVLVQLQVFLTLFHKFGLFIYILFSPGSGSSRRVHPLR